VPSILKVLPRLDHNEMVRRFKNCRDAGERMRWQAVLLKSEGRSARDIADICKRREDWVRRTVRGYNERGPIALVDRRHENGPDPLLGEQQRAELAMALAGVPPDGGLWSARKVTQWIKEHTGIVVTEHTGWLYMVRVGFTRQVPRPKHPAADEEAQDAFKKGAFEPCCRHRSRASGSRGPGLGRRRSAIRADPDLAASLGAEGPTADGIVEAFAQVGVLVLVRPSEHGRDRQLRRLHGLRGDHERDARMFREGGRT
jgi:transposase